MNEVWDAWVAAVLALSCAAGAHAASFPGKMIHLVVPFPPGGVADLVTRTVGQKVAQDIGQPVVVDNKPGASGIIGAEHVARAAPDGYTLLVANLPVMSINELQYSDLPYSASRDFTPVVMLADQPYIIAAKPGLPVADLAAFTRLAKQKPGALTFGSASSSTYLAGELFNARAGTRMTHVPYKGSAPAINDLLGGHIDLLLDLVITLLPHARAGKIRALAVTSPTLFSYAPAIRFRDTVHVAGQIPKTRADTLLAQGVVGESVDAAAGREAVRLCVLHALAWVKHLAGGTLADVERVLRVNYFFQVGRERGGWSQLADEGSELLVALFGERGRHPRSVIGVSELPRNAPVLVDLDIALREGAPGA